MKSFWVLVVVALLLSACGAEAPASGLTDQEWEQAFPPVEESLPPWDCQEDIVSCAEKYAQEMNLPVQYSSAIPMAATAVFFTAADPVPGDEVLVVVAILATAVVVVMIHTNEQHDMRNPTAQTYAHTARSGLTMSGGPRADLRCIMAIMLNGAIRYGIYAPNVPWNGQGVFAWWQNTSWGGAYQLDVQNLTNSASRGVDFITEVACSQLPPPPAINFTTWLPQEINVSREESFILV